MTTRTLNSVKSFLKYKKYQLFDVSLRDGIQSAKNVEKYSTENKKKILDLIIKEKRPESIEVGSYVSSKVLPIMKDTEEILQYGLDTAKNTGNYSNFYVLVPNIKQMTQVIKSPVINSHIYKPYASINFSFISSVSESFQNKNVKMSIEQTKRELVLMTKWLSHFWPMSMTKLYISCINECPIEGKIDNAKIIREIGEYNYYCDLDEICLSDTKGTLTPENLDALLSGLKNIPYLPSSKLSLHLHGLNREKRVDDLLEVAINRGITQFDVSMIEEGGCSVTMGKNNTKPNLTYETIENIVYNRSNNSAHIPEKLNNAFYLSLY